MNCDVAILGAGPAGLATALALHRHEPSLSIAVLGGPPGTREKIGETLPPGAQAVLRSLGLWEPFLASAPLPAFGTCAAWGSDQLEANEFIFHPDGCGWHIDRRSFDQLLVSETERRDIAIWPYSIPPHWQRSTDGWRSEAPRVFTSSSRGVDSITARFVVDATGRSAVFATRVGATRISADRLVALSVSFRFPASAPMHDTYALVEACPDGWWFSSLCPDGRLIVAFMTDADLARTRRLKQPEVWLAAAQQAPHTHRRIQNATSEATAPVLRVADSGILDRLTGEDWLATGDAASTVDPLSSQGVLKALQQGKLAAYAVADHLAGDVGALPKYRTLLEHEHRNFLAAKRDQYRLETRWPGSPFWQRRQEQIWLHPDALIQRSVASRPIFPLHLSARDLERLRHHGVRPRAAQEVVANFAAEAPSTSGEQIILALQHLVEAGAMSAQSA